MLAAINYPVIAVVTGAILVVLLIIRNKQKKN